MKRRILERKYTTGKIEYVCEEYNSSTDTWDEMVVKAPVTPETRPAIFDSEKAAMSFLYQNKGEYIISENVIFESTIENYLKD